MQGSPSRASQGANPLLAVSIFLLACCACQSAGRTVAAPLTTDQFLAPGGAPQISGTPTNLEVPFPAPSSPPVIDLATALRMGGANSLQVALAREQLAIAQAQHDAASVLLLPTLTIGGGYQDHAGALQETLGPVVQVERNSVFLRGGLVAHIDLAQAFLEPGRTAQQLRAANAGVRSSVNHHLTRIAMAHQDLLQAQVHLTQTQEDRDLAGELVELTEAFAAAGQGLESDAARARSELAQRSGLLLMADNSLGLRSTRLGTLLRLDPSRPLRAAELKLVPMALFPGKMDLDRLIDLAQQSRPELHALRALVRAEESNETKEDWSFLIPRLNLGLHTGRFGGAAGSSFRDYTDTDQFSATLTWSLRNLGFGEAAARRGAEAHTKSARLRLTLLQDQVIEQVIMAHMEAQSGLEQIRLAHANMVNALRSLELNLERTRAAEGLPIEALQAIRANAEAKRAHSQAIADFNRSQFRLLEAVGTGPGRLSEGN